MFKYVIEFLFVLPFFVLMVGMFMDYSALRGAVMAAGILGILLDMGYLKYVD